MRLAFGVKSENLPPDMPKRLRTAIARVVLKNLKDAKEIAQSMAPVVTGATRAAIHVVHTKENNYDAAVAESESLNPGGIRFFSAENPPDPDGLEGYLYDPAVHAFGLEYGTAHREATPFIGPALEAVSEQFLNDCNEALTSEFSKIAKKD